MYRTDILEIFGVCIFKPNLGMFEFGKVNLKYDRT